MQLAQYPLAVLVFHADKCGACQAYLPKLRDVAAQYADCVPTLLLDVAEFERLANELRVQFTPTTLISRAGRIAPMRIEGDAPAERIAALYESLGAGCDVDG